MSKFIAFIKQRKRISLIVVIILIVGGYYWYNKSQSSTAAVQYKTSVAEKGSLATSVSGSGNVTVDQLASIDPTITGTVANLAVNVGDKVAKGQFLFEIRNDDLSANVTKAYSSYLQSQGSLKTAIANRKEAKNNYDDATLSTKSALKKKLEAAEISETVAGENVKYALNNYNIEKKNYADRKVVAPIAGTVNVVNVKNGDDLSKVASSSSSYSAPIVVGDLATLKAEVQVNEVDVPNVELGQKVMMTFSAIDNLTVSGKVEKMDALGTITQGVVNYNVIIGFDTLDKRIKPSMSVSAKIITGIKQDVIVVSNSALKTQNNETYIEVLLEGSSTPEKRTIEIGASNNTETEIVSGIKVGDNIVTQTIDPNAKTTTTTGGLFGGGGNRGGIGALH